MSTKKKSSTAIVNEVTLEQDGTYVARYGLPEITITGKKKKKPFWVSPSNPRMLQLTAGEALEGVNIATGPLLNWIMPSNLVGSFRDSSNPGEFALRVMSGKNSGLFTENFNKEYPITSTVGNLVFDIATPLGAAKAVSSGNRLYKTTRLANELNKTILSIQLAKEPIVPGYIGWSPKLKVYGYHASNEAQLIPDFWYEGWAQKRGAPYGFYMAEGTAPESGFLSDRPYIHQVSVELDKPMVLVGDIPTLKGVKNSTRNNIERMALESGADGIIYNGIADNQMQNLVVTKTLNPDVNILIHSTIPKIKIGLVSKFTEGPITPPTVRTAPKFDPFLIRQLRIQNKINAGIIPETLQSLIVRNGESEAQIEQALVNAYKQMGISEQDARPWARHLMKERSEGVHTPVVSDDGKLLGGVSYVDRQRAIEMLRQQGITNPTEADIRTILGHEYGHLVDAPYGDKEFFTLMGQVLDNEGITSANPNLTVELILDYIDNYLALGRLDNGISARKEEILDMPYKQALLLVKMINRYSAYIPPIALSTYIINKNKLK